MKRILDNFDHALWWTVILFCAGAMARGAGGAAIPGFQPWINLTGINVSYTYNPLNPDGSLKPDYAAAVHSVAPRGFRFMDWNQTVASPLANWADRPLADLGATGVSYETDFKTANAFHAIPWLNLPDLATNDYAFQLGKLTAQKLDPTIRAVYVERGNEYWNGGDQYQGTANLFRARANPALAAYSDTEKMARQAAIDGVARIDQFRAGYIAGGGRGSVIWELGGFSPNKYFAFWQLDQLQKMGRNPAAMNMRLAVANYVEGSPTDIAINPTDSYAAGLIKMKAFVDVNAAWDAENKSMADSFGLLGTDVDEFRAGTSGGITQGAMLNWWLGFQNSPQARELQNYAINKIVGVLGVDAAINIEGIYGIAYSEFGQFSLLNIDQLNTGSQSLSGVQDMIDFSNTPEPSSLATGLTLLAIYGLAGQRRRKSKPA